MSGVAGNFFSRAAYLDVRDFGVLLPGDRQPPSFPFSPPHFAPAAYSPLPSPHRKATMSSYVASKVSEPEFERASSRALRNAVIDLPR